MTAIPILTRTLEGSGLDGTQALYRFANDLGASVVRHQHSYGGPQGLYELAVLRWHAKNSDVNDPEAWSIVYDTPITSDVLGWLTDEKVAETLAAIEALP